MTHEELLEILEHTAQDGMADEPILKALRAVVELCNKWESKGSYCLPIEDVIQAIKKELE